LLLSACDDAEDTAQAAPTPPPPQVGFVTLHAQKVVLDDELPGRTVAYRKAEVRPQVDGIITKRLFDEGASVKAGQPLYQIDPATYQAAVKVAEAELSRAQAALKASTKRVKRNRDLVRKNVVSEQAYDDAVAAQGQDEASVAAARAQLERARINLEYTVVKAPIAGVIGRSAVTEGALVTANQDSALATITQLDPIYVDMTQPSADLLRSRRAVASGKVIVPKPGELPVTLVIDDLGHEYDHEGRVQFAEVMVKETTGSVTVRAVFPNPDHELMPGLFVRGIVNQGTVENAFLVPQAALVRGSDGQPFVWLIGANDQITRQPVIAGRAIGQSWLVTEGLSDGDRVAVDGLQRIRPNIKVTPVAAEREGGKPDAGGARQAPAAS
jgi:membrane fusion protein (multidrug efflux system)